MALPPKVSSLLKLLPAALLGGYASGVLARGHRDDLDGPRIDSEIVRSRRPTPRDRPNDDQRRASNWST